MYSCGQAAESKWIKTEHLPLHWNIDPDIEKF